MMKASHTLRFMIPVPASRRVLRYLWLCLLFVLMGLWTTTSLWAQEAISQETPSSRIGRGSHHPSWTGPSKRRLRKSRRPGRSIPSSETKSSVSQPAHLLSVQGQG